MLASFIGTSIEWYDFFLYGTAAALVFNKLFFPTLDPLAGTMASFATYAVGFFARPLGGIVFGHYGDKIGRKSMLVTTLMMMGLSTFLIGVLPTYDQIGVLAPVALVVLRFVQGLGVGGEWGGAVLLAVEHGHRGRRGFYASSAQAGVPAGLLLANGAFAAVSALPEEQFLSWGWRVPFLAGAVLLATGPVHPPAHPGNAALRPGAGASGPPATGRWSIWCGTIPGTCSWRWAPASPRTPASTSSRSSSTRMPASRAGISRDTILAGRAHRLRPAALLHPGVRGAVRPPGPPPGLPGRGAVHWGCSPSPSSGWWTRGVPVLIWLALVLGLTAIAAMYGPQAAFFSELFGTNVRYSGASLGSQLAAPFAGGLAPLIATALLGWSGGQPWPVALYMIGMVLITFCSVFLALETAGTDLSQH